ncbi:hypothetical protein LTS08_007142 [Lithohypha guttulata]|nr:hypothetical protein LTS08_007142 [Lithohypha guttulata]
MPPKKLPPKAPKPQQQSQGQSPSTPKPKPKPKNNSSTTTSNNQPAIPEHEVKQSSSVSAQLALEAAKKAYELRQAAYGAGDPNAREEILAKAINKEIEAESFGKAAKYTRSGAFQGLAAGAGVGIQPGATLGKLTGALVGGVVSSVGGVLGGGIGSAYGAMSGPFWDLGQIASQGVRSVVGDFPSWEATSSQKKALEKMVMGAQQTKAPDQDELEEMKADNGGVSQDDYKQFATDITSWLPSMPSMPSKQSLPSMPSMPSISSIPGLGGKSEAEKPTANASKTKTTTKSSQSQQANAPAKPQTKPQSTPAKAPSQTTKTQEPQKSNTTTTTAKQTPKKPKVQSTADSTKSDRPAVRKAPAKLGPSRKPAAAANG